MDRQESPRLANNNLVSKKRKFDEFKTLNRSAGCYASKEELPATFEILDKETDEICANRAEPEKFRKQSWSLSQTAVGMAAELQEMHKRRAKVRTGVQCSGRKLREQHEGLQTELEGSLHKEIMPLVSDMQKTEVGKQQGSSRGLQHECIRQVSHRKKSPHERVFQQTVEDEQPLDTTFRMKIKWKRRGERSERKDRALERVEQTARVLNFDEDNVHSSSCDEVGDVTAGDIARNEDWKCIARRLFSTREEIIWEKGPRSAASNVQKHAVLQAKMTHPQQIRPRDEKRVELAKIHAKPSKDTARIICEASDRASGKTVRIHKLEK